MKVPQDASLSIVEMSWESDVIDIKGIKGEIEIEGKNADMILKGISGAVVASSVSGDIEIIFNGLDQVNPSFIKATSGFVDISLPGNAKADLRMRSISGEIYTDFDVKITGEGSWAPVEISDHY